MRNQLLALPVLAALASPAAAGDTAALRVIGFSPDGAVFAFEQYTMIYEEEAAFSEYVFIDTRTDRYLPDMPIKVLLRDDDGNDEIKAREQAAAKAAPLIAQHKVAQPGTRHEGKASMALDEIGIYQMSPGPLAKAQAFALPDGRKARLTISQRALGKADCDGAGGRGVKGKVAVAGIKLTLTLDGKPTILQEDRKLPEARRCVSGYGIAETYLHAAPDGAVTIAAIIETVDNHDYHAGPNRLFMAVTRRLAPK